ncbi:MAG: hypothetical protein ACYC1W_09665 [Gemmatimonadaceae bacterium]
MTSPEPVTVALTAHQRTIYRGLVARAERAREAVQTFESAVAAGVLEESDRRQFRIHFTGEALQLTPEPQRAKAEAEADGAAQ